MHSTVCEMGISSTVAFQASQGADFRAEKRHLPREAGFEAVRSSKERLDIRPQWRSSAASSDIHLQSSYTAAVRDGI